MTKLKMMVGGALMFLLSACATFEAETNAQRVFALKSDFATALVPVAQYEALPRCELPELPVGALCSDRETVREIRMYVSAAHTYLFNLEAWARGYEMPESFSYENEVRLFNEALTALNAIVAEELRERINES